MKNWHILALIVMMLMVAVPFLVVDRQYPMQSGDTQNNIAIAQGGKLDFGAGMYPAQGIGFALVKLDSVHPERAFLWFDLAVLAAIMTTLYFVFSRLVSRWAGVMAVLLAIFCSAGIATLFFAGAAYSIANVFIILPWGLYFLIRWLTTKKIYYAVATLTLFGLFSVFHPTAVYLAPILLVFFGALALSKEHRKWRTLAMFVLCMAVTVPFLIIGVVVMPSGTLFDQLLHNPTVIVPGWEFLTRYVGIGLAVLLVFGAFMVLSKMVQIKGEARLLALAVLSAVAVMLPVAFTGLSIGRSVLDLAAMLALLAACLLGAAVKNGKVKGLAPALMMVAIVGAIPLLKTWLLGAGIQ